MGDLFRWRWTRRGTSRPLDEYFPQLQLPAAVSQRALNIHSAALLIKTRLVRHALKWESVCAWLSDTYCKTYTIVCVAHVFEWDSFIENELPDKQKYRDCILLIGTHLHILETHSVAVGEYLPRRRDSVTHRVWLPHCNIIGTFHKISTAPSVALKHTCYIRSTLQCPVTK